jgi:hypothetical protein
MHRAKRWVSTALRHMLPVLDWLSLGTRQSGCTAPGGVAAPHGCVALPLVLELKVQLG